MRIIFFLFFFIYPGTLFANVTLEIEKKLKSINTVVFNFVQKTSSIQEKGECYLSFPGQLRCIYESDEGKEVLVKGDNLYLIKHKFKRSYRYPISNSAFNIILNKNKILENLTKTNNKKIQETNDNFFYEIETDEGIYTKILFDKNSKILTGWETISYNQEKVIFNILNPVVNQKFDEKFILPNYNNF